MNGSEERSLEDIDAEPLDFDLDEVHALIARGQQIPPSWVPSVIELEFELGASVFVPPTFLGASEVYHLESISAISQLTYLERLSFDCHKVSDLSPLQDLTKLEYLMCSNCAIIDITPVQRLHALAIFICHDNEISDLEPLSKLPVLEELYCATNSIVDLSPLSALPKLRYLDCSYNPIESLLPVLSVGKGVNIEFINSKLPALPSDVKLYENIGSLLLWETACPGFDPSLFGDNQYYDCKDALIAHFTDLQNGPQNHTIHKALFLGNGQVGKTQIRRRLFGQGYDHTIPSTHGIQIETDQIAVGTPQRDQSLSIWDFGGQDLYHGTHGLFIGSGGLFIVCWTPKLEDGFERDPSGLEFPNRPLTYWLSWIAATAGKDVAVICIQTQADNAGDARPLDPIARELLDSFAFHRTFAASAKVGRGLGSLTDALNDAFD
jgi:internalin A